MDATSSWTKIGVLTPATNRILERDFWGMMVPGATMVTARIYIEQVPWETDEDLERFAEAILPELNGAIERVRQAEPDFLVMGISISNLLGGLKGNEELKQQVKDKYGLELVTPVDALDGALKAFGAQRIGVITPYRENFNPKIGAFFDEMGIEVVAQEGLGSGTAAETANIAPDTLREALRKVNVDDADALVQLGTDLNMAKIADEAEGWLGKPVIAINTAIWWTALRKHGIEEKVYERGRLMREF